MAAILVSGEVPLGPAWAPLPGPLGEVEPPDQVPLRV